MSIVCAFPLLPKVRTMADYSQISTAALAKHVFEHLKPIEVVKVVPPTTSPSEQTATRAVALGTALLFLKIWITTSIEGAVCVSSVHIIRFTSTFAMNHEIECS